jgi:hypothetical protein
MNRIVFETNNASSDISNTGGARYAVATNPPVKTDVNKRVLHYDRDGCTLGPR